MTPVTQEGAAALLIQSPADGCTGLKLPISMVASSVACCVASAVAYITAKA